MTYGSLFHAIRSKIILNCNNFPYNKRRSRFYCYTHITVMGLCLNWKMRFCVQRLPLQRAQTHTRCVTLNDTDHWCVMQWTFYISLLWLIHSSIYKFHLFQLLLWMQVKAVLLTDVPEIGSRIRRGGRGLWWGSCMLPVRHRANYGVTNVFCLADSF